MADEMDKELLKAAQRALQIADVSLRATRATLADGFDPKYDSSAREAQFMQRTSRSEVIELANGEQTRNLFRVFMDVGVRWVRVPSKAHHSNEAAEAKTPDPEVLALIEATFIADYDVLSEISPDALSEFALHNAPWHVWPYWREFAASQCERLNLAKMTMPLMRPPVQLEARESQA